MGKELLVYSIQSNSAEVLIKYSRLSLLPKESSVLHYYT